MRRALVAVAATCLAMLACTGGRSGDNPAGGAAPGQSGGASRSGSADSTGSVVGAPSRGATTAPRDSLAKKKP